MKKPAKLPFQVDYWYGIRYFLGLWKIDLSTLPARVQSLRLTAFGHDCQEVIEIKGRTGDQL